jgi:hypothetical protein
MRILNARYATRNFTLHMVVNWTSSITLGEGKKELAVQNEGSINSVSMNLSEMEKQLSLAAQKATVVYHTAVHNHSSNPSTIQALL